VLFGKTRVYPSVESVSFDTAGHSSRDSSATMRAWSTPDGDGLGVCFFAKPPDIPTTKELGELRSFYDAQLRPSRGATVEVSLLEVDGCRAVKTIAKIAQNPWGLTFLAAITIPFRDFSFVLKVQCEEHGTTGIREAMLIDKLLRAGAKWELIDGCFSAPGFDPYNERFDGEFPMHPLSRARRAIQRLITTARVDAPIKRLPSFYGIPEPRLELRCGKVHPEGSGTGAASYSPFPPPEPLFELAARRAHDQRGRPH
jgi:hypothetical protein